MAHAMQRRVRVIGQVLFRVRVLIVSAVNIVMQAVGRENA